MRNRCLIALTAILFVLNFQSWPAKAADEDLADRLSGRILLQVEEHGEAWYVNPDDQLRYYMKDGPTAYEMMRSFGLGITDADLSQVPQASSVQEVDTSSSACYPGSIQERVSGKILLQVQQHGEAWYVDPDTCRRVYMQTGDAAYEIMRYLSLGITDEDLDRIASGTIQVIRDITSFVLCDDGYVASFDDIYCYPECGDTGTFCSGNSKCVNGQCVSCKEGYYLATDGLCYPVDGSYQTCRDGFVLASDGWCYPECGNSGTFCVGDEVCLNGECLSCLDGYYLASDGYCYPDDGGEYTCAEWFVMGDDGWCYPECGGSDTYCAYGSTCYYDECITCDPGYYLGEDGYCYLEDDDEGYCGLGFVLGDDYYCHEECGDGYYCPDDSYCYNGDCVYCDPGYYLGTDGYCYPENSDYGDDDYIDYCNPGYVYGDDGYCHEECGDGYYCIGDSVCYYGDCVSCDPGYYLGTDGYCYPENSDYGDDDYIDYCDSGWVYGDDGYCHEECGDGYYCTGDAVCFYGECLSCDYGYYLGTDGNCYPEEGYDYDPCGSGYVLGDDDLCHEECGDGYYCTGSAVCWYGECLSCGVGYYLATDGYCYPY